ncbi:hypothetical protein P9K38_09970 [Pseudomonas sp. 905_Psudmo1]|nr:hypothetical protein [Pseudomonas sp. 905_Psudmo1]WFS20636.1 hypothetical protein P9K38_09970 [Pseudomonas sp. 905_Psudmo1]
MPYAADGRIGRDPIEGGIEITEQQYRQGLDGVLSGEHVQIINGEFFVGALPEPEPEPEPEPTPEEIEAQRLLANNAAYEDATRAQTADYPQSEKDTWTTQDQQTAAWLADPIGAVTPWIDLAAAERGIDREEYMRRTLIKSRQFKLLSAFLTGRRQRYEGMIKADQVSELDYALTPEIIAQLQQIARDGMTLPAAELKGVL